MSNEHDLSQEDLEYALKAHRAQEALIQKNSQEKKLFLSVYDHIENYTDEQIGDLSISEEYKDGLRGAKQRQEKSERFRVEMIEKFGPMEDAVDERSQSEIENLVIDIAADMIRKRI